MIKFNCGWIGDDKTGAKKDIVVKAVSPNTLKDALIGCGLVAVGITYLTVTAFKNGAKKFDAAQWQTLDDLNLLEEIHDS